MRHELDSPNLDGHLSPSSTPAISFFKTSREWAVTNKENWTPYRAYLQSDLRTSPPLKLSQTPRSTSAIFPFALERSLREFTALRKHNNHRNVEMQFVQMTEERQGIVDN
ncbi:hypothetical protein AVEN_213285-1 [Araneus ventricosus]|uniref:Uncharacterized protein n=1 Tax=Araneus ventricosus TaxID=182803 RepID=A0A4Y2IR43_ARAVE|nr:hypothetical protein AVEN_213285-1 [Araneus ventricosus]